MARRSLLISRVIAARADAPSAASRPGRTLSRWCPLASMVATMFMARQIPRNTEAAQPAPDAKV